MTKLDFSKPDQLQTRDGRQVRIYATDCGGAFPIHGSIFNTDDSVWELCSWTDRGTLRRASESLQDLVPKTARIKGWMNVYPDGVTGKACSDQGECKKNAGIDCLGQIYIDAEVQE